MRTSPFLISMLIAMTWPQAACFRAPQSSHEETVIARRQKALPRLGYMIQVGAFAHPSNAARLAERLQTQGLEATYYASEDLFRVRFGDFPTKEAARQRAETLQELGVIQDFYVVAPEDLSMGHPETVMRANLVDTASGYLGIPYLWGGTTSQGFDCSGFTMSVYRLNGLRLPRSSRDQFEAGRPIDKDELQYGDLVFFATNRPGRVSHVGMYVGDGAFIHAPSRGKSIRREELSSAYYLKAYLGARTYL